MEINKTLNKPYFSNTNVAYRFWQAVIFGAFVSLFLIIFHPFNIASFGENWKLLAIGFGAVTFIVMILLNVILPKMFSRHFDAERWTVKKEIIHSILNFITIGAANSFYFLFVILGSFSWEVFLTFQFFTLCVGILPMIIMALYREKKDYNRFSDSSKLINSDFQAKNHVKVDLNDIQIQILSKNKNENLTVNSTDLLVIKSMDNYLEVYSNESKEIVRNTLKNVEENLKQHNSFYRCHKSYIVNLDKVISISGNAQGYKLSIENHPNGIPVSRNLNEEIKTRLLSLS